MLRPGACACVVVVVVDDDDDDDDDVCEVCQSENFHL